MDLAPLIRAVTVILAGVGAFFFFVGTVGLLRLPDFYARTHAATKCDTVGAGSVLLALAIFKGIDYDSLRILTIALLVLLSSPTTGHALARAAYRIGLKPWRAPEADVARATDPEAAELEAEA